ENDCGRHSCLNPKLRTAPPRRPEEPPPEVPDRTRPGEDVCRPLPQGEQDGRVKDKILLVEDNVPQQQATATFLGGCGYEVLTAADSESARQLLAQTPDVIVTDLRLAGGDGLEVLREAHAGLPETPVIIMTGYGSISSAVEAMKQGAFDY